MFYLLATRLHTVIKDTQKHLSVGLHIWSLFLLRPNEFYLVADRLVGESESAF
jgi:hypothetical protein